MRELGFKVVNVWLDPTEVKQLDELRASTQKGTFFGTLLRRAWEKHQELLKGGQKGKKVVKSRVQGSNQRSR